MARNAKCPVYSWNKLPPAGTKLRYWIENYYGYHVGTKSRRTKEICEAHLKAINVLLQYLNRQQREDFIKHGKFYAKGNETKNRYLITWQEVNNVILEDKIYCAVSRRKIPTADLILIQKILIENDESEYLRRARKTTTILGAIHYTI